MPDAADRYSRLTGSQEPSGCASGLDPFDIGAAAAELGFEGLETAVEVIDPVDGGLAFRCEAGDHEGYGGTQIGRHDGCPLEPLDPLHEGAVPIQADPGAEAREFLNVHEAVLENGLADARGAFRARHQGHELRLKIGR